MNSKIEVSIGKPLIELAERAADRGDKVALLLVGKIAQELLTTDKVDTADNADFLSVGDYVAMLVQAIDDGSPLDEVKGSRFRSQLD